MLCEKMPFALPRRIVAGAVLFDLLLCAPALAYPTSAPQFGPSGLGLMPTTDTVATNIIEIGAGYEDVDPAFGSARFFPTATINYGFERGEIGAGYLRERVSAGGASLDFDYLTAHGKYRVWNSANGRAAIALGAHYLDFDTPGHVLSLYATGSYVLWSSRNAPNTHQLRGHLGVLHQRIDGGPGFSVNETRPMAGLEYRLRNWVLAADFLPSSGVAAKQMSAVARYDSGRWGAQVGVGEFRGGDRKIFGSFLFRFGGQSRENTDTPPSTSTSSSQPTADTSSPRRGGRIFEAAPDFSHQEAAR